MMGKRRSLKELLFEPPDVKALLKLPRYEYDARDPSGIASVLQSGVRYPEALVMRIPILPDIVEWKDHPRTKTRYGHYLPCREKEDGQKPLRKATHLDLLLEHFPLAWEKDAVPAMGTLWKVPGTERKYRVVPFIEQLERALLTWYDRHKYPRETPAAQVERIAQEVRPIPLEDGKDLAARITRNGAHYFVQVPSRTSSTPHRGAVYHVPVIYDPEHISRLWRSISWRTGSVYNQVLQAAQPSLEQAAVGEREYVTAEQLAQLDKIVRFERNRGNNVPLKWAPIIRFHKSMFSFLGSINRTVVWLPGHDPRTLYDPERSALIGYALRNNNESKFAILQEFPKREEFRLGRLGALRER